MTKKKEREASQLDFDYTQAEKFNKIVTTKLEDANFEVHNGIAVRGKARSYGQIHQGFQRSCRQSDYLNAQRDRLPT
jgi:hypothetical protein